MQIGVIVTSYLRRYKWMSYCPHCRECKLRAHEKAAIAIIKVKLQIPTYIETRIKERVMWIFFANQMLTYRLHNLQSILFCQRIIAIFAIATEAVICLCITCAISVRYNLREYHNAKVNGVLMYTLCKLFA